jgi:hypothetical protein
MDINVDIKREKNKKEEKKPEVKTIFTLECKVDEVANTKDAEEYKFSGKVKADKMDSDLMASIFANILKQSVPAQAMEEVFNLTAEKLGLCEAGETTSPDDFFPDMKAVNIASKKDLFNFLNKLLGE